MSKNPIQFQKCLSLLEFLEKYGTDKQCQESLINLRWPQGFVCPSCGDTTYYRVKSRDLFQCKTCRRQISVISGTIFASTEIKLSIWFLGISTNAALRMKHKLQHVMKTRDDSKPLSGILKIDDAYLGGKRGRGAPGKEPVITAVASNEKSIKFR